MEPTAAHQTGLLDADTTDSPRVVLGWGLGVESTAILVRWILEPDSRDFDLADLVVLTALTGDEFAVTHQLVESHLLNLLRAHQIRWVQVCRAGQSESAGISVVDDSRAPTTSHRQGPWRLSDELVRAGTVPQFASGRRLCSIRAKGSVLDRWIASNLKGPYRHVLGFNAAEMPRVLRDRSYSSADRHSEYPLITWGWDREACESYLEQVFGVSWHKSCCGFCPFRGGALDEVFLDWAADPAAATDALLLERRALALNPNMTLYAGRSALEATVAHQEATAWAFADLLEQTAHDIVEVRRIIPHTKDDPTKKAPGWRSVRIVSTGSLSDCTNQLGHLARALALTVETDEFGIVRAWARRRTGQLPDVEQVFAVCPTGVVDKERPGFEARWAALVDAPASLFATAS